MFPIDLSMNLDLPPKWVANLRPHVGVSLNGGTPKWMVYNGKPYQNGWFGGTIILGNPHVTISHHLYTQTKVPPQDEVFPALVPIHPVPMDEDHGSQAWRFENLGGSNNMGKNAHKLRICI